MAEGSSSPAPSTTVKEPRTYVNLQFLSPSPENEISLSDVELDIEVGALLNRVAQQIPTAPSPERMRLIYQGRALADRSATLRSYLQRELESNSSPDTFKIHLVTTHAPAAQTSSIASAPPHGLPTPPHLQSFSRNQPVPHIVPNVQGNVHVHQIHGAQPAIIPPTNFQSHGQNHFHQNLQTQLQTLQQQLQQLQHGGVGGHPGAQNPMPHMFNHNHGSHLFPGMPHAQQGLPNFQAVLAQQQQQRAMNGMHGIPLQPQMQTEVRSNSHGQGDGPPNGLNPQTQPHRQTTVQEIIGSSGQRIRVTTAVESVVLSRTSTPQPAPANIVTPNAADGDRRHVQPNEQLRPQMSSRGPQNSDPASAPATLRPVMPPIMPFLSQMPSLRFPASNANIADHATAWLLLSPAGPQAILFSPEHGIYSSQSQSTPTQMRESSQHVTRNENTNDGSQQPRNALQRQQHPPDQAGPVIIRRRAELQQQNNDLLAMAVARIWLFVRLYLFVLMFTEPGSWLRWAILTGAVLYCCIPPNNIFQDQFRQIQGHLEGLVPLAPPGDARQPNNNDVHRPAGEQNGDQSARGSRPRNREPTPQEVAERILRQRNERNNSWFMETSRRIERAVALFFASLVPGVGERHIRARNEAEAARQAAERARQETQDAEQASQAGVEASNSDQVHGGTNAGGEARAADEDRQPEQGPPPLIQV